MIRLLYLSQANPSSADDLESILRTARQNNPPLSITGVLVHGGGWYMQLIEGPERSVLKLYAKIIDDSRHSDPRVIHITPATEALFGEWSMGFTGISNRTPAVIERYAIAQSRKMHTFTPPMMTH